MITRQLLPIFVLSIEVLAPLGCGSQSQAPSDVTQRPNQTLSKIDPVGDASKVAAVPGLPLVSDLASYSAQQRAAQFVLLNSRQHVLSSGFPKCDY
jgi:hypothetical protein